MTKRRRHRPDQIIRKLAEGSKLLAGGAELDEVCRHLQVAESTWHRWVAQDGGMKANDAKRLKEIEVENTRLKKLLAEAELGKAMPKEIAVGTFYRDKVPMFGAPIGSRSAVRSSRARRSSWRCGRRSSAAALDAPLDSPRYPATVCVADITFVIGDWQL